MIKYLIISGCTSFLLLTGCASSNIGFGIGGIAGDSHGGTEVLMTEEGIHGSIAAGGDFVN